MATEGRYVLGDAGRRCIGQVLAAMLTTAATAMKRTIRGVAEVTRLT